MSGGTSGSGGNRDRLVKDLSERLRTRTESGDLTELLGAEVLSLARDLGEALSQDFQEVSPADFVAALSVLVAVRWIRYQLLPEGQDQDDLQACLKWSEALLPLAPHLVPEPVLISLAGPGAPIAAATDRGIALYGDYERTGDLQFLQSAITCFGEAVDATAAGNPDRPGRLSNLGTLLRTRFGRTGEQADLDQAISLLSEAVDATPADHPGRSPMLSNLGAALRAQFGRTSTAAAIR
jgi:hypothetical protein